MQIGNKIFKPGLIPTIVFLLILPVLLRLGFWQLERAEEKQNLITAFEQRNAAGPVNLNHNNILGAESNYRDAVVTGEYNISKQIFIDNKIHKGQTGVHVVTPLKIKNSDYSVLVNRGWVAMAKDRSRLPEIKTPTTELFLKGKVKISDKAPFTVGEQFQSNKEWPALIQWINFADIEKKSGLKILPYIFLLDEDEASGYARGWTAVVSQPEKSLSYAVQWFALAFALIVIYIVVNLKKVEGE